MSGVFNHKIGTLGVVLALAGAAALAGGGFWITLYSPKAPVATSIADAAVVVAAQGCGNPAEARFAGTAEGLVAGKRQSIPLTFVPTSKPGVYAVKKQWGNEGIWVLAVTATYQGRTTSALVEVGNSGGKIASQNLSAAEIDAALKRLAGRAT